MAKRAASKKIFSILIFLVLGIFTVHRFFFFQTGVFEKISATFLYPLLLAQRSIVRPVNKFLIWYKDRSALIDNLAHVVNERDQLLKRVIEFESVASFVHETNELIKFKKRFYGGDRPLVQIIMRQLNRQESYILVDVGSKQGIRQDMVAMYKNCLIGRVIDVYPSYSKVILITDRRCKVAAYCSKTRAQGIHEGMNNCSTTALTFVSHLQKVREGDLVMTSGQGIVFPKGFALGRIKYVSPSGLYYRIEVEPLVDFNAIDYCYLIDKGQL